MLMRAFLWRPAVCIAALSFGVLANAKTPCDEVRQQTSADRKTALQAAVAKQLKVSAVDLLAVFADGGWSILYVDTHQSDEVFLLYSTDPVRTPFLSMWSGAAMRNEGPAIEAWAQRNVSGIPQRLAACFAWYATVGR